MNGSKKWIIKEQDEALVEALSSALGVKEIVAYDIGNNVKCSSKQFIDENINHDENYTVFYMNLV